MDRMDPTNFDQIAHERRTTVRAMEIGPDPDATRTSPGYRFTIEVGRNTSQSIALNAREIRRLASLAARAALRFAEALPEHDADNEPRCPACGGDVHIDLSGAVWTANSRTEDGR